MDASGSGPLRLKVACCRARRVVGNGALRVLGSVVAIPRPMRPCARPGFDGRPELRPVSGGDAEPDRGAGGAEGLARGEDHRDHGVLALLTELIFEGFGHIAHHTSSVRPTSSAPRLRANCLRRHSSSLSSLRLWLGTVTRRSWGLTIAFAHPTASRRRAITRRTRFPSSGGRGGARPRPPARTEAASVPRRPLGTARKMPGGTAARGSLATSLAARGRADEWQGSTASQDRGLLSSRGARGDTGGCGAARVRVARRGHPRRRDGLALGRWFEGARALGGDHAPRAGG